MKMNRKKQRPQRCPGAQSPQPSLRFSPYAWAKLLCLRDRGETEIGGFGLCAADDPLLVVDVLLVKQRCSICHVAFDDASVADLFDSLVDQGLQPERFSRIWIHTHPGDCPLPSGLDEDTFRRVFGRIDWSVMAILARSDATYARLAFRAGPGGALEIPVGVDYRQPFAGTDWAAWLQEYDANVVIEQLPRLAAPVGQRDRTSFEDEWLDAFWDLDTFEEVSHAESF